MRINERPQLSLSETQTAHDRLPAPRQEGGDFREKRFCPMRSGQGCWKLPLIPLGQASGNWQLVLRLS